MATTMFVVQNAGLHTYSRPSALVGNGVQANDAYHLQKGITHNGDVRCGAPPAILNANIVNNEEKEYLPGAQVYYECKEGFQSVEVNYVICTDGTWSPPPVCNDVRCGPPPVIENGRILGDTRKKIYLPDERVHYQCRPGLRNIGSPTVTCKGREWSDPPICREAAGKCGPPPIIDNGDMLGFPQAVYNPGSSIQYKCQNFHKMDGRQYVYCDSGQWTDPPVCLKPCTASPEEMEKNNIKLKWKNAQKLFSESGDIIEFACKEGYEKDVSSSPLRA
ncbi:complement factor H-related protein 2-like, partial [Carettochelys insculpta]|uniref:complement factor H-related protein 2-like n=1 Tax=Carettochelys insculpta TaxID=44489 RepID=UPI003EC11199